MFRWHVDNSGPTVGSKYFFSVLKIFILAYFLENLGKLYSLLTCFFVTNIFRPRKKQKLADLAKMAFNSNYGDLVTMLNVYVEWERQDRDRKWCHDFFVNNTVLRQADSIREQLLDIMLSWVPLDEMNNVEANNTLRLCDPFKQMCVSVWAYLLNGLHFTEYFGQSLNGRVWVASEKNELRLKTVE